MATTPSANPAPGTPRGLYGAIWRWHFYAGLFTVPFMLLLAVTGGLYLFQHEIEERWYAAEMQVPAGEQARPLSEQAAAVLARHPQAQINGVRLARSATLANEWSVKVEDGRSLAVFVDPWRATVTGELDSATRLMSVVSELHGSILAGRFGDTLIELAASWAFVLIVTGVYLWWPRGAGLMGTLIPRLGARGRVFWRDLHAVPAIWNALLVALLILSGLPWAGFWGDQLAKLGQLTPLAASSPHFRGALVPASRLPGSTAAAEAQVEAHHHAGDSSLSWGVRHTPVPLSGEGATQIGLDPLEALMKARGLWQPGAGIGYPQTPSGVFKLGHLPDKIQGDRMLYVDQYSGEPISEVTWDGFSPLFKVVEYGVSLHLGRQFGLVNQLVGLLSCLLIVLTAVSGTVMWWKRRPVGALGAPSLPKSYRTQVGVVVIAVVLGIVFPLMGASLVAVLILDALLRRLPPTKPRPATP